MPCTKPLEGWLSATANDSGKYPVTFSLQSARSDHPMDIPCGKCPGCIRDRSTMWAVRCYHESTMHDATSFVTLTYSEEYVPDEVSKEHVQKFVRKCRDAGHAFRYFACGEYGTRTLRPHYHLLMFGEDWRQDAVYLDPERRAGPGKFFLNPKLEQLWNMGRVTVQPMEVGTIFYTVGYMTKETPKKGFHLMSKRPYLGHGWLSKYHDNIARLGFVVIDGRKIPVPKGYLNRPEYALELQHLKEQRAEYVRTAVPGEARRVARDREINLRAFAKLKTGALA